MDPIGNPRNRKPESSTWAPFNRGNIAPDMLSSSLWWNWLHLWWYSTTDVSSFDLPRECWRRFFVDIISVTRTCDVRRLPLCPHQCTTRHSVSRLVSIRIMKDRWLTNSAACRRGTSTKRCWIKVSLSRWMKLERRRLTSVLRSRTPCGLHEHQ